MEMVPERSFPVPRKRNASKLNERTMIHLNDEQTIPLQDSELDAVSGGTAVEYTVMLALIILAVC